MSLLKPRAGKSKVNRGKKKDGSKGRKRAKSRTTRGQSELSLPDLPKKGRGRGKSNLFSSMIGASSIFGNILDRDEDWIVPEIDEEQSYEFRGSDLAYLWVPSTLYKFQFKGSVDSDAIRKGLESAVENFPIVAGRLRILGSQLVFDEETHAFSSDIQAPVTRHRRILKSMDDSPNKLRLHAVILPDASSNCGVLFEKNDLTQEAYNLCKRHDFFPRVVSVNHPNKEPLLKVKLTTGENEGMLVVEAAAVLADIPAMAGFFHYWSESCKLFPDLDTIDSPDLNREFTMSTEQFVGLPKESDMNKYNDKKVQIKNIWKNSKMKSSKLHPCELLISNEYVEKLRTKLSDSLVEDESDSEEDLMGELAVDAIVDKASDYEVLAALSFLIFSEFFDTSCGLFCVDKRGKCPSAKYNYFGVACAFMKFEGSTSSNDEEGIFQLIRDISSEYRRCVNDRDELDAIELEYETLFAHRNPLTKQKNIVFDSRHQAPFANQFDNDMPIFVGATDFEENLLSHHFGTEDGLYSFDLDSRRVKNSSKIVKFFKHSNENYKIQLVLDSHGLNHLKEVKAKFPFLAK